MEKFSVKKPFTVLVAVIMVLMLGFVSITKMKTNLLPNVSTPYLMVVTVYPGASPERVETEVSDVLQNALTVPGVSKITATSAENYSLLLMQFVDDTDMDSALVQVSNKLDQAKSDLPETALTPSVIQYSMNMNAFMTVAVSREGSSVYDLSDFIKNTMTPYVQRKGGVSSVSCTSGSLTTAIRLLTLCSSASACLRTTSTALPTSELREPMTVLDTVLPKFLNCLSYSARPALILASASSNCVCATSS